MLARLKRLLSPACQKGVAAETRGEFEEAARCFHRAGLAADRLRVQLIIAHAHPDPVQRRFLQAEAVAAAAAAEVEAATLMTPRRELAHALLELDEPDARKAAAALLADAGQIEEAADLLLAEGEFASARHLLEAGRLFERLEAVDRAEAKRRSSTSRAEQALAEALGHLRAGRRREAEEQLIALERAADTDEASRTRAGLELQKLRAARISGRIRLRSDDGRAVILVAGLPVVLGRGEESPLPLTDAGVSRRHARLLREGGCVCLEDLGSRNGTLIDGLPLGDRFIFEGEATFSLGEAVRLRYTPGPPITLELLRGLAAGTRCAILREGDRVAIDALFEGPGTGDDAHLELERGRYRLRSGEGLRLSGTAPLPGEPIELADGDTLEWSTLRLTVGRG